MDDEDQLQKDLLAAFQSKFGLSSKPADSGADTGVLKSAEHIYNNAIDVSISRDGVQAAAGHIAALMRQQGYSPAKWAEHELHPTSEDLGSDEALLGFVFTMDLLNFSFWADEDGDENQFAVSYRDKGYWSLVAALRRAVDQGIPVTDPHWWQSEEDCTLESLGQIFRGCRKGKMPLLEERLAILKEAGAVLYKRYDCSIATLIEEANGSAARLVNYLAEDFSHFRDQSKWEDEKIRFLKRAQIFVADVWACFQDYRVPQMLNALGCLSYSPPLETAIVRKKHIAHGHDWEIQIRGCCIWAVELIRRQIIASNPHAEVNAILIDFFLYDTVKDMERQGDQLLLPHHRTRCSWY